MNIRPDFWGVLGLVASMASPSLLAATPSETPAQEASPIRIDVNGASEELAANLKAHLPSMRHLSCQSPRERIDRLLDASQDKVREGAEAMGYFSAEFQMSANRQANCWVVQIAIQPGESVKVTQSQIRVTGPGNQLEDFRLILASLPYQTGDVLVSQKYEDFKTSLARTASRLGFFDAKFVEREIKVDPETYQAAINLHFDTGKRYAIGAVTVDQEILDEKYINRYVRMQPGQSFDSAELLRQQRILESSGYFSDVQISSRYQDAKEGQVPVEIKALRNKRYAYTGKLGYGTGNGLIIETGMEARWVNRKGHKMEAALRFTETGYIKTGFKYIVPLWKPEHEYAGIDVSLVRSKNDLDLNGIAMSTRLDERKLEFNYNRRNRNDWQQTAFISFFEEKFRLDIEGDVLTDTKQLTLLGARVSKTKTDDPIYPREGWRLAAELKGAHKSVLSDATLMQGRLDAKYLRLLNDQDKLILRGAVGATWVADEGSMPKSLGFITGGQDSIRGYDANTIGELDEFGDVVGSENLLITSVEYERPVTDKISLAAFVDAGNAFNEWESKAAKLGAGVGVRYKSPLGPVRVDFAVPREDHQDVHFYFSLGPDL